MSRSLRRKQKKLSDKRRRKIRLSAADKLRWAYEQVQAGRYREAYDGAAEVLCSPGNKDVIEDKIIKICDYLELNDKSFDGFINWVLELRKKLDMPHKLSEVIDEKDLQLDRLSKMALDDL